MKRPVWYVTSEEYMDLLRSGLKTFGDMDGYAWHPEDIKNHVEVVIDAMDVVFSWLSAKPRSPHVCPDNNCCMGDPND